MMSAFLIFAKKSKFCLLFQKIWYICRVLIYYLTLKFKTMKKLVVLLAIAAISFGFTSCKKNCTCTGTSVMKIEGEEDVKTNVNYSAGKMSKSECESYKYVGGITMPGATIEQNVKCSVE